MCIQLCTYHTDWMDTITYIYMYTVNIACLHSVIHVQTVYIHYKFSHLICSGILVTCTCTSSCIPTTQTGWTPLISAACGGKCDVVTELLDNGADINAQSNVSH